MLKESHDGDVRPLPPSRLTFMHEPYNHAATMNANRGLLSILVVLLLRVIILTGSADHPEG
jgi:hypothetical protein